MGDVPLRLDPLAAFFLLLIAISAVFTAFFSAGYMKMYQRSRYSLGGYYCALGILAATMLLVVVVQNALAFLIVWELMSFSSFFLVSFEHESPQVRRAGLYYLVAMQVGAAFLVAAFAWMHQAVSSLDFADFGAVVPTSGMVLFLLFFVGFGTKAGFIPLHSWLPLAHPAAPSPVSAMMSGVMIKTGIYGILRMVMVLPPQGMVMAYAVLLVSLFTGLYGIMNALVQSDMKKMLAYSSIENIGIIGMGIGMAMLGRCYQMPGLIIAGYGAALLHLLNHFLFKSLLFWGAGALYTRTHTRDVESMGGLIHLMPITSLLFLVGTLGICGFPLFAGFVSEFILYWGFATHLNGASLGLTLALLGGLPVSRSSVCWPWPVFPASMV
jgi:formate hydrogenlyase subunit 3/multisubunit Na+/H+ antiporter MnhD subunit